MCVPAGMICDEPYKAVPEVNEEEGEYPCILDMDQSKKFVLGLKDEMTWYHRDKKKNTCIFG